MRKAIAHAALGFAAATALFLVNTASAAVDGEVDQRQTYQYGVNCIPASRLSDRLNQAGGSGWRLVGFTAATCSGGTAGYTVVMEK